MTTPGELTRADWPRGCPRPPSRLEDLSFRRLPMVDWLAPRQLASTAVRAALSSIFGAYADKREVQAALHPSMGTGSPLYDGTYHDDVDPDGFWLDYCADTGDGFDSTYALAWLLSRRSLDVRYAARSLPRGRVLILGGDQVYPVATRDQYANRLVGPYRAALPWEDPSRNPHLYAIPGNHDWYDGLTSFLRLFCQHRWVGGWHTQQRRSYFALRLPHNWWLWGTDIQLASDIDQPQLDFFCQVAQQMRDEAGTEEARLILCTAEPTWVYCDAEDASSRRPPRGRCRLPVDPGRHTSLEYLQRKAVALSGARLVAILSGDLHHYTHYEENVGEGGNPLRLLTAGGGGAYLYPTHHMPQGLEIHSATKDAPSTSPGSSRSFERKGTFPSEDDSRRLAHLSWIRLPWRNSGFSSLLAGIYLVYAWVIQSASKSINFLFHDWGAQFARATGPLPPGGEPDVPRSLMDMLAQLGPSNFDQAGRAFWDVLRHSPSAVVFGLVVVAGLWRYRLSAGRSWTKGLSGAVHGLLHLALSFVLVWFFAWLNLTVLHLDVDSPPQVLLFSIEMVIAGCLLGSWLFGLYLILSSRLSGAHMNEVFSSQRLDSFKNFLRLHIDAEGALTIYPVGIRKVPSRRQWVYRGADPGLAAGDAWFDPPRREIGVELIGKKAIETSRGGRR